MNTEPDWLRLETVIGSRTISNFFWALMLLIGTLGFVLTGLSSYFGKDLLPFIHSQSKGILFTPQGLVMCFYGTGGLFLSAYLWCGIFFNVGSGYNEFDRQVGIIYLFRWGFPGKNRKLRVRCLVQDVQAIRIEANGSLLSRHVIFLQLKDKQNIPLNQITESFSLKQIEEKAAQLAQFLQIPIEGISFY